MMKKNQTDENKAGLYWKNILDIEVFEYFAKFLRSRIKIVYNQLVGERKQRNDTR